MYQAKGSGSADKRTNITIPFPICDGRRAKHVTYHRNALATHSTTQTLCRACTTGTNGVLT
jgi:hypothetical protein